MSSISTKLSCATLSPADQQKVKETYSQVVSALSGLAKQSGFVMTYALEVNATAAATEAEAVPIPLAEVESEIFAEAEATLCDICHIQMSEKGLCETCTEHVDDGIKHYTEEFALASVHGKDAVRLFVLRQRAENCREICDTYRCEKSCCESLPILPEVEEAKRDEELVNKLAAECLARLPASFAPWWRDAWTYEKWWQVYDERKAAGWPLASADVPIVQRLAAAAVANEDKIHEMKKAHAEVLANIERARKEDMEAVEARHTREMAEKDKRYVEALYLDDERGWDKVRAECDKKCQDAERKGYAFADQKWNPLYKAVCEDLEAARKELSGWCERCVAAQNAAETFRKKIDAEVAAATDDIYRAMRSDLEEMRAENKALCRERDEANLEVANLRQELDAMAEGSEKLEAQVEELRKELKNEVDGATRVFDVMESDLERLRADKKALERRVAEESHWCKDANMATRTAEMHAQMLRTELAMLQKENEGLRKLVFSSLNLQATSSGVKLEPELAPELAPRLPQVVRASPGLVAALKAEKTWNDGVDVCYALTEKDYNDMIKAQGALPSVEVVEPDARLELLQKMLDVSSPPPSPILVADQTMECGAVGCYECPPVEPEAESELKSKRPNYNHHFWRSPTTKRFAKHIAKHSGKDHKTIKTHEDALEFLAKKAKLSVDDLLKMSIKDYQSAHEPWSLSGLPWEFPSPEVFHI